MHNSLIIFVIPPAFRSRSPSFPELSDIVSELVISSNAFFTCTASKSLKSITIPASASATLSALYFRSNTFYSPLENKTPLISLFVGLEQVHSPILVSAQNKVRSRGDYAVDCRKLFGYEHSDILH